MKHCQKCGTEEEAAFRSNQKNICHPCLNALNKERSDASAKEWEEGRPAREARRAQREQWEAAEQARAQGAREAEENRQRILAVLSAQPDRTCVDCHETKPALAFCRWPDEYISTVTYTRCSPCHQAYRERNRQVYPLCPMCERPTRHTHGDWLYEYQGFPLDIIKVCCRGCIPQFEALPEAEQIAHLRRAMVKTYGETAVIYGLQYDDSFHCHHIGRTKHLSRRMAEYRRNWDKPIKAYHVLEEIPFGPLSMERESRWMMHALKNGWPIDNFDMFTSPEMSESEGRLKARIIEEAANMEPLTSPFEAVEQLIQGCFINTTDVSIVNWLLERERKRETV